MTRVSVFVDGENISACHASGIVTEARAHGVVDLLRVYGDAGLLKAWEEIAQFRLIHSGIGKNAADLLLCVDAMERALSGACDVVVIASSDGDFRHLAERLRERGVTVVGMGQEKAGMRFKASCSRFVVLRAEASTADLRLVHDPAAAAPRPAPAPSGPAGQVANVTKKIIGVITQNGSPDTGLEVSALNHLMHRQHRVAIGHYPEKTWRGYLQARPQHFDLDPKGPNARVRVRKAVAIAAE
ncbi:NYN domain-containing protein [Nioella aestuarii]|uniref:NYN domain-containing protein n=1 Tax=Nioella aestuarii TaxID=1662864 RepID=UPI003D7F5F39